MVVVSCALIGLLLSGVASFLTKPNYVSETELFVALQNSASVAELQQGNVFTQARVQSYVETVDTPLVLQPVIDSLSLDTTPGSLSQKITASSDAKTVIIRISVADQSPVRAAAIAQAVGASLIRTIDELERPSGAGPSPVKLSIVTPAIAPTTPASPNVRLNLVLGFLCGTALGAVVTVLRSILDTRVRGEADLRRTSNAPLLGGISFDTDATQKPLITQTAPQSPRAESFRQLRTNLQFAHVSHESKTVLVTSSLPGEGKSTTATNLAIALAQAGQSVALVDADLRRPMVAEYLGLERNVGLTTVLIGRADLEDALQSWGQDNLYVLTSGEVPPNPSELLGSGAMRELLSRLENTFDAIVIDAPPLLPVTDSAVLAQMVGGVVLVVGSQKVRSTDLEKSLAALKMVDADLLGIVLNRLPVKGPDAYAYSYYSEDPRDSPETANPRLGVEAEPAVDNFDRLLHGDPRPESQLRNVRSRSTSGQ